MADPRMTASRICPILNFNKTIHTHQSIKDRNKYIKNYLFIIFVRLGNECASVELHRNNDTKNEAGVPITNISLMK